MCELKDSGFCARFAAALLIFGIAAGAAALIFTPKREFSEQENRALEPPPKLTLDSLRDGSFMKSAESYVGDHFALRTQLVSLNTSFRLLLGRRDFAADYSADPAQGGVYFGRNGHLYEVLLPDRTGVFRRNAAALGAFAQRAGVPLTVLPVPSGAQEQPENLPFSAPGHDQREELNALRAAAGPGTEVVDVFDALSLKKTGRDYYFKTDHHWNAAGAYAGYRALVKAMGLPAAPQSAFTYRAAKEPFYGTLYSKAIFTGQQPDLFELPYGKNWSGLTQQIGRKTYPGIYREEYLSKKDKYSAYLGGNPAVTVVRNPSAPGGKLLLLKDSFANSLVPYLCENFSEIHLVDLRYYNQDIYKYIKQNGIKKAAAVYSISQLCEIPLANKLLR